MTLDSSKTRAALPERLLSARRIAVVSTASGCGKTTLARRLAAVIDAPFIELDAMVHGPAWRETPTDVLLARLEPELERSAWVVDGNYRGKIGDTVIARAELVVWLDLSIRHWMPRLLARTTRRWLSKEPLWNGNRENLRSALLDHDSLLRFAVRTHRDRRLRWAMELPAFSLLRLCTPDEVAAFEAAFCAANQR